MYRRIASLLVCIGLCGVLASAAQAVIPLPPFEDWESNAGGRFATGLGVADLDHDGWVDLVVANGNDMARQSVSAYLNNGDGTFPLNPTWVSDDIDYNGHLDLADVNGDGHIDCAVAVYIGAGGFSDPGRAKLYLGNGDGTFSNFPAWESADAFYTFSLSFGDMDNDGDPDLACATGDDYYNHPEVRRVYRNIDGTLEPLPSWTSTETEYSLDVVWADYNGDGQLDLAFAGTSNPNRIYFSSGGTLQTTAGWSSADASIYANTAAAGDYDGDGWIDLAIADNSQLGGDGRAKVYRNLGTGTLSGTPVWESNQNGYGSHVSFIDIDEDDDLDLATGMWWGPVRIYENIGGSLTLDPAYTSATNSVIENEVWEDFDNDGLQNGRDMLWWGDGTRRLFIFPERPVRNLMHLTVGNEFVDLDEVYLDSDDGWIVLPMVPDLGERVRAVYVSSADIDLALTNWDDDEGEYIFYNQRDPNSVDPAASSLATALHLGPNPSDGPIRLWLAGEQNDRAGYVEVIDASGRRVKSWSGVADAIDWDGFDERSRAVAPGVYWVRWSLPGAEPFVAKLVRR